MENNLGYEIIMKLLFLDIDGVCNSEEFFRKNPKEHFPIDPNAALLVKKIILYTGCKVILSSTWRHHPDNVVEIEKRITPIFHTTPSCCTGIRGAEIYKWMNDHISYKERDETRYAILDDDSDMLLWQKDNFFQTSGKIGLTEEITEKIINHLGRIHDEPNHICTVGCRYYQSGHSINESGSCNMGCC